MLFIPETFRNLENLEFFLSALRSLSADLFLHRPPDPARELFPLLEPSGDIRRTGDLPRDLLRPLDPLRDDRLFFPPYISSLS